MNPAFVIQSTIEYVKTTLKDAEGGHDWWHIYRVWNNAKHIAKNEKVDLLIVELGALLHDIADAKFHNGDEEICPQKAKTFLNSLQIDPAVVEHVEQIIRHVSFKGGHQLQHFRSPELDVVQDADRLDAMGAIGIARAFNYGGFRNRALYDPNIPPKLNMTKEEYKKSTAPTLNHFYEKLLLLKERMNTTTGRRMAKARHAFMEAFLEQFYEEWKGNQ